MSSSAISGPIFSDNKRAPAGTAAAPSFAFNDSTGTGVYLVSPGVLGLSTAGVQRVVVDASGNVGIGVTPSAWVSSWKVIQHQGGFIGGNSATTQIVSSNSYSDGTNWRYVSTGAATQYAQTAGEHSWSTAVSGTAGNAISFSERMRIDASGNLLVGTTSAPGAGKMRISAVSSSALIQLERTTTSAGSGFIGADAGSCFLAYDSSINQRFYVTQSGNYWFAGSNVSDQRLKEDIKESENQLANVLALSPKTFRFKGEEKEDGTKEEAGRVQYGFIAQEVKAVIPELVTGAESNPNEYMGVDYMAMTAVLTKAIQEQQAQIEKQSQALEALKAEVAALKAP